MKKILLFFVLLFSANNNAQENTDEKKLEIERRKTILTKKRNDLFATYNHFLQDRKDKIKSLKIAFISQNLNLTSDEAEKFWPIYNKYDEKIMALKEAQIKLRHQKKTGTDEEALKKIEETEEIEAQIISLKKKMRTELIPVISAEKVVKLEQIEQQFHRKLLEKLKRRKENFTQNKR